MVWGLFVRHFDDFVISLVDFAIFTLDFYGMKRARVGAFTDFGGSRYRNPVHFLGTFRDFPLFSGFSGLVYYTGPLSRGGA